MHCAPHLAGPVLHILPYNLTAVLPLQTKDVWRCVHLRTMLHHTGKVYAHPHDARKDTKAEQHEAAASEMNKQKKSYQKLDNAAIKKSPYLKHMPERLPSSIKRLESAEKKERLLQRRDRLEKAQIKRRNEQ